MAVYLLDTGILIRHLRGRKAVVHMLRALGGRDVLAISAVTRAEIRAGVRQEEDQTTRRMLARLQTVPVDAEIADRAGDLILLARRQGRTLHLADALIAATAVEQRMSLVTLNRSDFEGLGVSLYPLSNDLT